jgi:hypothetical protein
MPVEFFVEVGEFTEALRSFFFGDERGIEGALEYVDLLAGKDAVTLDLTGASAQLRAKIKSAGYARIPYGVFEGAFKDTGKPGIELMGVHIINGEMKVGAEVFKHHAIAVRLIGARIADLPIDASLMDTLALSLRFSQQELIDGGVWSNVLDAKRQAAKLIEASTRTLEPLGIGGEALTEFVWGQIRQRKNRY